eukprot:2400515-Prymnesium_polylepis.1
MPYYVPVIFGACHIRCMAYYLKPAFCWLLCQRATIALSLSVGSAIHASISSCASLARPKTPPPLP